MRILIVHSRYRSATPSGENIVVDQELDALRGAGHDVDIFERHSDDIAAWSLPRKAALPAESVWSAGAHHELGRRIAAWRPDVVHVHNTFPLMSPSVLYACREATVPLVVTFHNYRLLCARGDFFRDGQPCHDCAVTTGLPAIRHGCYRDSRLATIPIVASNTIHRPAWRRLVSAYIFISSAQRDLMSSLDLPPDRVFVKHNFVIAPPTSSGQRRHVVTFVGRLDAAKGVHLLMRSWDIFRTECPDARLRLVVVGGGPMDQEVREWGATHDSVDLVGLVPRNEALALLAQAVAAVVPSRSEETFGLVAVEAMAAGVTPIAPAQGPFPELITDGVDGTLFAPGDPVSLAAALGAVERSPQRFRELGRESRSTYERRFQRESSVEQLLGIYRYAMANRVGN